MQNSNPFFSLIIPVYNTEEYLLECLLSVKNQTFNNFEVLVINDGSPNKNNHSQNVKEIFDQIQDSRFKLFTQENKGVSSARNIGLDNASGEFVHFIDSDDWLQPNHLGYIYKELERNNFDKTTVFYQADSNPFKTQDGNFVSLPEHRPVIQQRAKNNNFTKELVFFSIPEPQMILAKSLIGNIKMPIGMQYGEGPQFLADIYFANPSLKYKELDIFDSYMYRFIPNSDSKSEDTKNREVANYVSIYQSIAKNSSSVLQKIVCYLAIWRYKLILIKNPVTKLIRKFLTLISKIITNWYF
jgi:glycosyltransferase involved in cell wall biosynthesis